MLLQQGRGILGNIDLKDEYKEPILDDPKRTWFPFQLAFLLMNVQSIPIGTNYDEEGADLVDLIWFPTGGGKTEAYLGVAAFTMIYSRLLHKESKGTEVIMRYTLRLLTSQQFERAACLIFALEYLRKNEYFKDQKIADSSVGFSAGLWVGDNLTPNRTEDAHKKLRELRSERKFSSNSFALLSCPWCKTSLENNRYSGYTSTNRSFHFRCQQPKCSFYEQELPVNVVDEMLYENPPTLLVATVDKFAQLAWLDKTSNFLGSKTGKSPALIIQDELHLISGPLGSIVGHYEVLLKMAFDKYGKQPKIIASTATIRRAKEQVFSLYRKNFRIFPPPGLNYDDSFFAVEANDPTKHPGRRYVGVFSSGVKSHLTAQVRLLTPLIQLPMVFFEKHLPEQIEETRSDKRKLRSDLFDEHIDPYGTIVWYFNSLKELGYADNLINEDISQALKNYCRRNDIPFSLRKGIIKTREMTSRARE